MLEAINGMYDARKQTKAAERIKLGFSDWVSLACEIKFTLSRLALCENSPSGWAATLRFHSLWPIESQFGFTGPGEPDRIIGHAWGPTGCIDRVIPGSTYVAGTDTYLICEDVDSSSVTLTIFRQDLVLQEQKDRFTANYVSDI